MPRVACKTKMKPKIVKSKSTIFKLYAPHAKKVNLAGTFNEWGGKKLSLKKDTRGNWMVNLKLKPGTYEYKFNVDGTWITDPDCVNSVSNVFGSSNSIIEIK